MVDFFSGGRAIYNAFSQRLGTHSSENLVWIDFKKCFCFLFEYVGRTSNRLFKTKSTQQFMPWNKVHSLADHCVVQSYFATSSLLPPRPSSSPSELLLTEALKDVERHGLSTSASEQCKPQTLAVEECLSAIQALLLLRRYYEVMDRGDRNDLTSVPFPQKCFELSPDAFLSSETV